MKRQHQLTARDGEAVPITDRADDKGAILNVRLRQRQSIGAARIGVVVSCSAGGFEAEYLHADDAPLPQPAHDQWRDCEGGDGSDSG